MILLNKMIDKNGKFKFTKKMNGVLCFIEDEY